jgi:hypothetical protein
MSMSSFSTPFPRLLKANTLARLGWVSLVMMHGAPLWKAMNEAAIHGLSWPRAGGLSVLLGATLFFILKAVGVRFLKVRCRKTALVVFLACCGLAHGESAAELAKNNALATPAIVTTATAAAIFGPRLRKRLPEFLDAIRDALAPAFAPRHLLCGVMREVQVLPSFVPRARTSPPRGPPQR